MEISAKSLIFDYGATIDTNGIHWGEVILKAYENADIPVSREEFREAYVHVERMLGNQPIIRPKHTFRDVLKIKFKLQFEKLGLTNTAQAEHISEQCYENTKQTINRAKETLDVLSKHYPMALVSNFYGNLRTVLNEFGLTKYFRLIIESAETGLRKPDPAIYRLCLEKLGLSPKETIIIGDSYKNDINPAITIGCPSIWLKGKGWDDKDDAIVHPYIIRDFSELKNLPLGEI